MIVVRSGGFDHPDVQALVRFHQAEAHAGIPPAFSHALDAAGLAAPGTDLFTAWDGAVLAGMAALRSLDGAEGELKAMRTAPARLRRGVGRLLLRRLIAEARARGWRRLRLETGTAPRFAPANALYEAAAFGGYPPSPHNRFMVLDLG